MTKVVKKQEKFYKIHRLENDNEIRSTSTTMHPLLQGPQPASCRAFLNHSVSKSYLSEFTQRVMSGKLLQLKQYQNQLVEAQNKLQASHEENRALSKLLKRHEISLRRYEGENAGMPRLLRAHAEEVRTLRITINQLRRELRDVQGQIREKDKEICSLKETLDKLRLFADENKLFDLDKAQKKVEALQALVNDQNKEIQLLSRRILLDTRSHQRQLNIEMKKHKETRKALEDALAAVEKSERQKRALQFCRTSLNGSSAQFCNTASKRGGEVQSIENDLKNPRPNLIPLSTSEKPVKSELRESLTHHVNELQSSHRISTPTN